MGVRFQLVIDCSDADTMAHFWAAALGYVLPPPPVGYPTWDEWYRHLGVPEDELGLGQDSIVDPGGAGPRVWFQVVPDPKVVKNRLHLDVCVGGGRGNPVAIRRVLVDAEARRLVDLGATVVGNSAPLGLDHYAVAMTDPEGNEFDII